MFQVGHAVVEFIGQGAATVTVALVVGSRCLLDLERPEWMLRNLRLLVIRQQRTPLRRDRQRPVHLRVPRALLIRLVARFIELSLGLGTRLPVLRRVRIVTHEI